MKKFKIIGLLVLIGLFGCDPDIPTFEETTNLKITNPYLQIVTPSVSFQAGTPKYGIAFNIINTENIYAINSVDVYGVFTNASTGDVSERIAFKSYPVGDDSKTAIVDSVTYEDLRVGLTLPDNQAELAVGSGWAFEFEGIQTDGTAVPLSGTVRVSIQSRFAGLYEVVESSYFRIGVDNGDWNGTQVFIGSVDATTFSHNDYWGNFGWTGNHFTFTIDEVTNEIIVPLLDADGQLANGNPLFSGNRGLGCHTEPEIFTNVPCDGSNILIPDDVTGQHTIILTYGYFTDGSGAREFYEKMVKIN